MAMLELESVIGDKIAQPVWDAGGVRPMGALDGSDVTAFAALGGIENEYLPSWKFVAPPGVGDAPQHVFNTFALIPFNIEGPGDEPLQFLQSVTVQPVWEDQNVVLWGRPLQSGNFIMSPLWTPEPQANPSNQPFAGSGV